jgi:hypothetical protein
MKQMKLIAAVFGLLVMVSSAVMAKDAPAGMEQRAKNMAATMDSLSQTISNGDSVSIASAGDGVLAKVSDLGRADDSSVVFAGADSPRMSSLPTAESKTGRSPAEAACHSVCVEFSINGQGVRVCVKWESSCQ